MVQIRIKKNALISACENEHRHTIQYLLEYGIDPNCDNNAVLYTCWWTDDNLDIIKMLVAYGADLHYDNDSVLFCLRNDVPIILSYLLENNFDPQSSNNKLLIKCVMNDSVDMLKILLENGIDVNARNNDAIKFATLLDHTEIFRILIDHGADIHTDNDFVLKWSVRLCHHKIIEILEEMNIYPDTMSQFTYRYNQPVYENIKTWDCEINYEELDKLEKEINDASKKVHVLICSEKN
jgi:ankyrin repeat protein